MDLYLSKIPIRYRSISVLSLLFLGQVLLVFLLQRLDCPQPLRSALILAFPVGAYLGLVAQKTREALLASIVLGLLVSYQHLQPTVPWVYASYLHDVVFWTAYASLPSLLLVAGVFGLQNRPRLIRLSLLSLSIFSLIAHFGLWSSLSAYFFSDHSFDFKAEAVQQRMIIYSILKGPILIGSYMLALKLEPILKGLGQAVSPKLRAQFFTWYSGLLLMLVVVSLELQSSLLRSFESLQNPYMPDFPLYVHALVTQLFPYTVLLGLFLYGSIKVLSAYAQAHYKPLGWSFILSFIPLLNFWALRRFRQPAYQWNLASSRRVHFQEQRDTLARSLLYLGAAAILLKLGYALFIVQRGFGDVWLGSLLQLALMGGLILLALHVRVPGLVAMGVICLLSLAKIYLLSLESYSYSREWVQGVGLLVIGFQAVYCFALWYALRPQSGDYLRDSELREQAEMA